MFLVNSDYFRKPPPEPFVLLEVAHCKDPPPTWLWWPPLLTYNEAWHRPFKFPLFASKMICLSVFTDQKNIKYLLVKCKLKLCPSSGALDIDLWLNLRQPTVLPGNKLASVYKSLWSTVPPGHPFTPPSHTPFFLVLLTPPHERKTYPAWPLRYLQSSQWVYCPQCNRLSSFLHWSF